MKKLLVIFLLCILTTHPLLSMKEDKPRKRTWYEYFQEKKNIFFNYFKSPEPKATQDEPGKARDEHLTSYKKQDNLARIDEKIIRESKILDRDHITIDSANEEVVLTHTVATLENLIEERKRLSAIAQKRPGRLSEEQVNDLSERITRMKRMLTYENNLRYKTGIPAEFTPYTLEDRRPPEPVPEEPNFDLPAHDNYRLNYKK